MFFASSEHSKTRTINFFISNDGLKYEINPEEAEKRGILLGNIIMSCAASR